MLDVARVEVAPPRREASEHRGDANFGGVVPGTPKLAREHPVKRTLGRALSSLARVNERPALSLVGT